MKKIRNKYTLLILMSALFMIILSGCSKSSKPSGALKEYKSAWEDNDYEKMYSMLSKESKEYISQDDFVKRYKTIFTGIEAENLTINYPELSEVDKSKKDEVSLEFSINMDTLAGKAEIEGYNMKLSLEEKEWKVLWDEGLIFPGMTKGDKVKAQVYTAVRGQIFDRNGESLAANGEVAQIEIVYNKFIANKEANVKSLSEVLDISEEEINKLIENPVNPDWPIPVVKVLGSDRELLIKATTIDGVQNTKLKGRIYAGGESLGSLIGYIGPITAEELEKLQGEGYSSTDQIGKRGLEQVYDKRLKGENGGIIYISKEGDDSDTEKVVIAEKDSIPGEDITLTIDKGLQESIYSQLKGDKGSGTAINPKTGEVLAMVSAPSFDSNVFTTYVPNSLEKEWEETDNDAFTNNNRFKSAYAPGSTFKLITGAVALDLGIISPEEAINVSGLTWQKDSTWGGYKVTRVKDAGGPVNLKDAYLYSDNIYFAQAALKIGAETFEKKVSESFGIGEELPFIYPMASSRISNSGIENEVLLADSSYGQGEVQMTPLHIALAYSSVVNNGDIMKPVLEGSTFEVWKKGTMSSETASLLKEYLTAVIEDPRGSGHEGKIQGISLSGKTGTAELKKSLEDTQGEENGWFVAMDNDNPKIVLVMMTENVKNRGGSHYVIPKVKAVLEGYLKN